MMKSFFLKIHFFIILVCFTNICFADKAWRVDIQPLLWDVEFNGRVQVGDQIAHVDKTKLGGELMLQTHLDKWGVFANIIYSRMTGAKTHEWYVAHITNQFNVYTGGFSYEIYKHAFPCLIENLLTLEPYVGARYTMKNTDAKITGFWFNYEKSQHNHWTDPIVGMRLKVLFNQHWLLFLSGDIGGINTDTQYSYNTLALLSYQFSKIVNTNTSVCIGYQLLDQHYVHGKDDNYLNWNMKIKGPVLGIFFSF